MTYLSEEGHTGLTACRLACPLCLIPGTSGLERVLGARVPEGELVLVKPPPELEQNPDVLWRLTKALYGLKTSPKLWQQHLASKLEELGLRKNKADPCIFVGEKLLVMIYVDDLLIVGEKQEHESFLAKLSAHFPLKHQTKLGAKTPLTFLGKLVEYNAQEHSISLHLPTAYYLKLFKMYGMEHAKPAPTTRDKLGQSDDPGDPAQSTFGSSKTQALQNSGGQTSLGDSSQTRHKLCCQRTQQKLAKPHPTKRKATQTCASVSERKLAVHDLFATSAEASRRTSFDN